MKFSVTRGTRYALGIDLPFILSKSDVAEWARAHGFGAVAVRDRPSGLPYDPRRAPGGYSDTWDVLVEATYQGTASSIEAPGRPAWVLVLTKPAKSPPVEKKKTPRKAARRAPAKSKRKRARRSPSLK
jgi:hypothetical protein